jgi:hypothetical protein
MTGTILKNVGIAIVVVIAGWLGAALITFAQTWTAPTASPPGGNTPEPINVSSSNQVKAGGFWAASLGSSGGVAWNGGQSLLQSDQGGSIELGGTDSVAGVGAPYIDFHFSGLAQDYNARLINNGNRVLTAAGSSGGTFTFDVIGNVALNNVPINTPGTINAASNPLEWTKLKNVPADFADGFDDTGSCTFETKTAAGPINVPSQCLGKACVAMWRNSNGTTAGSARIIQWPGTNYVSSHTGNSDAGVGEGKYREYIGTNGDSLSTTLMSRYGSTQSFTVLVDNFSTGNETSASQWWVTGAGVGTFAFCN